MVSMIVVLDNISSYGEACLWHAPLSKKVLIYTTI